jgi:uncharacterized protein YndB with AHSA1/START domain
MNTPMRLIVTTPSDREIAMTRVFTAPRRHVFDAFTQPELIRRWLLGPEGWTMPVCVVDLRVGGKYRYEWKHANGNQMAMEGVFREIVVPERLVATEKFDDPWYPGGCVNTSTFVEKNGKTTLTTVSLFDDKAARDAVLASPMEEGVAVGYDRLAEILESM